MLARDLSSARFPGVEGAVGRGVVDHDYPFKGGDLAGVPLYTHHREPGLDERGGGRRPDVSHPYYPYASHEPSAMPLRPSGPRV